MNPSSRRARVLIVSGLQVHPTTSGGTLRSFALANALVRHGLEVRVHSLTGRKADYLAGRRSAVQLWPEGIEEYVDRTPLPAVAHFGSGALGVAPVWITAGLAAATASPGQALLPRRLREQLEWCDVVVADFPFLYPVLRSSAADGKLRVVSTHNVEHELCSGPAAAPGRWLRSVVRRIELEAAQACDLLVACCAADAQFFAEHARVRASVVVPNGVDLRRFQGLARHRAEGRRRLGLGEEVRVILFTASRYGPNRDAYEYLLAFAHAHARWLAERRLHVVVAGNVAREPVRSLGFTATGRVEDIDPYFAAADAALNPVVTGAGTNLKTCEFIAARLPVLTTAFGARGFRIEDGRTGFLFERDGLLPVLSRVAGLFEEDPARLATLAAEAYAENEDLVDMDAGVRALVRAIAAARGH